VPRAGLEPARGRQGPLSHVGAILFASAAAVVIGRSVGARRRRHEYFAYVRNDPVNMINHLGLSGGGTGALPGHGPSWSNCFGDCGDPYVPVYPGGGLPPLGGSERLCSYGRQHLLLHLRLLRQENILYCVVWVIQTGTSKHCNHSGCYPPFLHLGRRRPLRPPDPVRMTSGLGAMWDYRGECEFGPV
jgi:hypothetical protein